MNNVEIAAIQHNNSVINTVVDIEEILCFLGEEYPDYAGLIKNASSATDAILLIKHESNSFQKLCKILEEDCMQGFIVERLQHYVDDHTTESDSVNQVCNPCERITTVHYDFCKTIFDAIIEDNKGKELSLHGIPGSGKTYLLGNLREMLKSQKFKIHHLNFRIRRFASIINEIQSIANAKSVQERSLLIMDGCSSNEVDRIKDGNSSPFHDLQMKNFFVLYIPRDCEKFQHIPSEYTFNMPKCSSDQLKIVLSHHFNFDSNTLSEIVSDICCPYPLHAILTGSLYYSCSSALDFKKELPATTNAEEYISQILNSIFRKRYNPDEICVLSAYQLYDNIESVNADVIHSLVSEKITDKKVVEESIKNLVACGLLVNDDGKSQCISSNLSDRLAEVEESKHIWIDLVHKFCYKYLNLTAHLINNFVSENKADPDKWESYKSIIIKSLTFNLPGQQPTRNTSFFKVAKLRYSVTSKLRPIWQARILTREEAVDIYESVLSLIKDMRILDAEAYKKQLLNQKRTILIHYLSLFFYLRMLDDHEEHVASIFLRINEVMKEESELAGGVEKDDLYFEFIQLIIDYRIYEGNIKDAKSNLITLSKQLHNVSNSNNNRNNSTRIRLQQVDIITRRSIDSLFDTATLNESSTVTTDDAYKIKTQLRIAKGDKSYMDNDFITAALNYNFALLSLQDISSMKMLLNNDCNILEQDIRTKIGILKLQSNSVTENRGALKEFKKCQDLYLNLEKDRKNHKYMIYTMVAYLVLGDTNSALTCTVDILKYFPNKKVLIGITDRKSQEQISRNLQERLNGPELKHIDNHVYQGKVNFLSLTQENYEWVKRSITDEIIEIQLPQKSVRVSVLSFPILERDSDKCLVVVFREQERTRHRTNSTNISSTIASVSSLHDLIEIDSGAVKELNQLVPAPPDTLIDTVLRGSRSVAKGVLEKAKYDILTKIASSVIDRFL